MTFQEELIHNLKTDNRLVDETGELVITAAQDLAWKLDNNLIRLLLRNNKLKEAFFQEIDEHWIFDTNSFIDYLAQKDFLVDSYTRFGREIGLIAGDKYLKEGRDVVLAWPYKDCILEGGQEKEDENRHEIFFNEILAQDEISQFFAPKVLTSFSRHSKGGHSNVESFKRTEEGYLDENLIIRGNNLLALSTIESLFWGRIKLIYIDPPYNTGSDSFKYNDNFSHSTWLTFIKNRMEIAYNLLADTGLVYVQCNNNENAYLKVLLDEIFGRGNFISEISWQRAPEGRTVLGQGSAFITDSTEYILVYAKDSSRIPSTCPVKKKIDATEKALKQYNNYFVSEGSRTHKKTIQGGRGDKIEIYEHSNFKIERIPSKTPEQERIANFDKLTRIAAQQEESSLQQKILSELSADTLYSVEYVPKTGKRKGQHIKSYYFNNGIILILSDYAEVEDNRIYRITPMNNFWSNDEIQITGIADEGQVTLRRGKKPELLLHRIIKMSTEPGDYVLDFCLGSGTTAAVAHKMGRKYIGIEQLDYSDNDSRTRVQNVLDGEQSGISRLENWTGGGDFVYCELKKLNEIYVQLIQDAKDSTELLGVWENMSKSSFLKWYVNPKWPEQAIDDFLSIGESQDGLNKQKKKLIETLDKNQLYLNLTEINDLSFDVSDEEKRLNASFYGRAL